MQNQEMVSICHRSVKIKGNSKEYKYCQNLMTMFSIPVQMDKFSSADNS